LLFEPDLAFLRYLRIGDREIVRGIYAAVRDRNWDTIAPRVSNLHLHQRDDGFLLTFDVECREREVDFRWKGEITGDPTGRVTFRMDGEARSTFKRNRIGFCVLHPVRECAEQPCAVEKPDGATERGSFPRFIAPHQPFRNMRVIAHEVLPGLAAEVRFEGDVFEMEDQRNWTDASFKTYCTPLERPYPVEVPAGTRVSQAVTLALRGQVPPAAVPAGTPSAEVSFEAGDGSPNPLPRLGLGFGGEEELTEREMARLRALNLAHLRVDLRLSDPGYVPLLERAGRAAAALGTGLEAALFVTDAAEEELTRFAAAAARAEAPLATCLVFHTGEKAGTEPWTSMARRALQRYQPQVRIGGGTNAYFTELNRARPRADGVELICFSVNPQVHAFDNATLVENLEGQAETVRSARHLYGEVPIGVTPVTLRPRFNPNATGPEPAPPAGELPSQVDPRQMSLFGAGWTLGSVKHLAESGAASATYYETAGWRGVMEAAGGSPLPEKFRSLPGAVFPLYHVLAEIGEFAGGAVVPSRSSAPLSVDGMLLTKDGRMRLLLANLSPEPQRVRLRCPAGWNRVLVSHLDESNAEAAMREPEPFRAGRGTPAEVAGGEMEMRLRPYAVAWIDAEGSHG
jgi:hypothetical protein